MSRRRRGRAGRKPLVKPEGQRIELTNPQKENYGAFIVGNTKHCDRVVQPGTGHGKTLVICGAGPSLKKHAAEYCSKADEVWGCNSAAVWLHENGHKITHAFTVDQQPQMVDEWFDAPPIHYLLASSVHPHLVDYLIAQDREITFFHNFVGVPGPMVAICECGHFSDAHPDGPCVQCECDTLEERVLSFEQFIYARFWPSTVCVGAGLNATTRAIDLAGFMGFDKIQVLGADSAIEMKTPMPDAKFGTPEYMRWLREDTVMHADGGSALASDATPVTLEGEIDGRHWLTKPDLIISAVWLVRMARTIEQVELIGDTLPNALMDKDDAFLDTLPHLTDADGRAVRFDVALQDYNFVV